MRAGLGMRGAALVAALLLAGCGDDGGALGPLGEDDAELPPSLPPIPYEVDFAGDLPPELASLLAAGRRQRGPRCGTADQPPRHPPARRGRPGQAGAGAAGARLFRRHGRHSRSSTSAEAPPQTAVTEVAAAGDPARGRAACSTWSPGPRYRFGTLAVDLADNPDAFTAPTPKDLGLVAGEPALTQAVLDAEQKLLAEARKAGFALAKLGEREAIVDHATRDDGRDAAARPGPAGRVRSGRLHRRRGHRPGLPARPGADRGRRALRSRPWSTEGQNNLFDTNLFSTIVPRPAETLTDEQRLDLDLRSASSARRARSAPSSTTKPTSAQGGRLFWEHRNIFGAGERFRIEAAGRRAAAVADREPAQARLPAPAPEPAHRRRPAPRPARSLRRGFDRRRRQRRARDQQAAQGLARHRHPLCADRGPEGARADLCPAVLPGQDRLGLRQRPVQPDQRRHAAVDRDPLRRPARHRPQFPQGPADHHPLPPAELGTPLRPGGLRGSIGALGGVSRDDVPADERFYAGGGGSIRGIGFELAGPLDDDDKPLGGRSVVEGSVELRTRFANNFGAGAVSRRRHGRHQRLPELRGAGPVRRRPELSLLHAGGADPVRHRLPA